MAVARLALAEQHGGRDVWGEQGEVADLRHARWRDAEAFGGGTEVVDFAAGDQCLDVVGVSTFPN